MRSTGKVTLGEQESNFRSAHCGFAARQLLVQILACLCGIPSPLEAKGWQLTMQITRRAQSFKVRPDPWNASQPDLLSGSFFGAGALGGVAPAAPSCLFFNRAANRLPAAPAAPSPNTTLPDLFASPDAELLPDPALSRSDAVVRSEPGGGNRIELDASRPT
jgi:hypothetical protein